MAALLAASDTSGLRVVVRILLPQSSVPFSCSTCILGTVFPNLHSLRKEMQRFLLEVFFSLVYSCKHGSCRYERYIQVFLQFDSHQVVCTRAHSSSSSRGVWVSVGPRVHG